MNSTEKTTHNFGYGDVPAHRHKNPDDSLGGWVADTSLIAGDVTVPGSASVGSRASVGDGASVGYGASPHFARLTRLRELISRERESGNTWKESVGGICEFDIRAWHCGQAACVGGSLALDPASPDISLMNDNEPAFGALRGFSAVGAYLGLSCQQTQHLCAPHEYPNPQDIDEVLKRIDELIALAEK